jgi:hypothetical protein
MSNIKIYQKTPISSSNITLNIENQNINQNLEKQKLASFERKAKLKEMLISKYIKKYNLTNPENQNILQEEISKILMGEKITEKDLKYLDEKLKEITSKNKKELSKK